MCVCACMCLCVLCDCMIFLVHFLYFCEFSQRLNVFPYTKESFIPMCACVRACMCACACGCICVRMHMRANAYACARMYACLHACEE